MHYAFVTFVGIVLAIALVILGLAGVVFCMTHNMVFVGFLLGVVVFINLWMLLPLWHRTELGE